MTDYAHLKTPRTRRSPSGEKPVAEPPTPDPRPDVLPPRWRIILGVLAFVVAALCFVVTWLLISRAHSVASTNKTVADLACQVQRLGGQPLDNVHCPPKKSKATPSSTPTPSSKYRTPSPPPTSSGRVSGVGPFVGPTSAPGATTPPPAQPQPQPSRTPAPSPSSTHRPSPSPKPSSCANLQNIAKVCLTPLAVPPPLGTVWLWL